MRRLIYALSAISFLLAIVEGIGEPSPKVLIIHLSVSLFFLTVVYWCTERPLLIAALCVAIQTGVVASFLATPETDSRWLLLKFVALGLSLTALTLAFQFRNASNRKKTVNAARGRQY